MTKVSTIVVVFSYFFMSFISCTSRSESVSSNKLINEFRYWEDLTSDEQNVILNNSSVNRDVISYYNNSLNISDNKTSIALLETITSTYEIDNEGLLMLYFFVLNQIVLDADGAVTESLGKYCQRMVLKNPTYIIKYFKRNKVIFQLYADLIGYELYFKEEGTSDIEYSYSQFKNIIEGSVKPSEEFRQILSEFFRSIEIAMKNAN